MVENFLVILIAMERFNIDGVVVEFEGAED